MTFKRGKWGQVYIECNLFKMSLWPREQWDQHWTWTRWPGILFISTTFMNLFIYT
jgi:hypothetical protein